MVPPNYSIPVAQIQGVVLDRTPNGSHVYFQLQTGFIVAIPVADFEGSKVQPAQPPKS